jgi:hypothetical protein
VSTLSFTGNFGSNASSSAGTTLAVTVTVNVGDVVIVCCATVGTAIQAPTDNASGGSNPYFAITPLITNTNSVQLWMCVNAKAATTVTMNNTSSRRSCCVATYRGSSVTGTGASTTGSGTALSLATTQRNSDSWIVTGFAHEGTGTFGTPNTGNLRVSIAGSGSTTPGSAIMDNTGAGGASITCSTTNSASTAWTGVSAELQTFSAGLDMVPGRDGLPRGHWSWEIEGY